MVRALLRLRNQIRSRTRGVSVSGWIVFCRCVAIGGAAVVGLIFVFVPQVHSGTWKAVLAAVLLGLASLEIGSELVEHRINTPREHQSEPPPAPMEKVVPLFAYGPGSSVDEISGGIAVMRAKGMAIPDANDEPLMRMEFPEAAALVEKRIEQGDELVRQLDAASTAEQVAAMFSPLVQYEQDTWNDMKAITDAWAQNFNPTEFRGQSPTDKKMLSQILNIKLVRLHLFLGREYGGDKRREIEDPRKAIQAAELAEAQAKMGPPTLTGAERDALRSIITQGEELQKGGIATAGPIRRWTSGAAEWLIEHRQPYHARRLQAEEEAESDDEARALLEMRVRILRAVLVHNVPGGFDLDLTPAEAVDRYAEVEGIPDDMRRRMKERLAKWQNEGR